MDPATGEYKAYLSSPTGIPADPALTSHGVDQSKDLAAHLNTLSPPIEQVYSSPYYRCLQTVEPFVKGSSGDPRQGQTQGQQQQQEQERQQKQEQEERQRKQEQQQELADGKRKTKFSIRAETGLGEWYGSAPFEHPSPASPDVLKRLFPAVDLAYRPIARPTRMGESISELHDRVATTMEGIVAQCDREGTRAILICSHAATVIALGRVLTGVMPVDIEEEDFRAFTCGLSVYRRRGTTAPATDYSSGRGGSQVARATNASLPGQRQLVGSDDRGGSNPGNNDTTTISTTQALLVNNDGRSPSDARTSHADPIRADGDRPHGKVKKDWRGGVGVAGGWLCLVNSECSFLKGGEERGWYVRPFG